MRLTLPEFPFKPPKRRLSMPVSLVSDAVKGFHQPLEPLTCTDPHLRTTRRTVFQPAAWQMTRHGQYTEHGPFVASSTLAARTRSRASGPYSDYVVEIYEGRTDCRNPASFAVALYCGIGSSSLNALVNAFDRLHIVRAWNSSCTGCNAECIVTRSCAAHQTPIVIPR